MDLISLSLHPKINIMKIALLSLDADVLNRLYKAKERELESAILVLHGMK
jgi:hypothetical protein